MWTATCVKTALQPAVSPQTWLAFEHGCRCFVLERKALREEDPGLLVPLPWYKQSFVRGFGVNIESKVLWSITQLSPGSHQPRSSCFKFSGDRLSCFKFSGDMLTMQLHLQTYPLTGGGKRFGDMYIGAL